MKATGNRTQMDSQRGHILFGAVLRCHSLLRGDNASFHRPAPVTKARHATLNMVSKQNFTPPSKSFVISPFLPSASCQLRKIFSVAAGKHRAFLQLSTLVRRSKARFMRAYAIADKFVGPRIWRRFDDGVRRATEHQTSENSAYRVEITDRRRRSRGDWRGRSAHANHYWARAVGHLTIKPTLTVGTTARKLCHCASIHTRGSIGRDTFSTSGRALARTRGNCRVATSASRLIDGEIATGDFGQRKATRAFLYLPLPSPREDRACPSLQRVLTPSMIPLRSSLRKLLRRHENTGAHQSPWNRESLRVLIKSNVCCLPSFLAGYLKDERLVDVCRENINSKTFTSKILYFILRFLVKLGYTNIIV